MPLESIWKSPVICECGSPMLYGSLNTHRKTKRHLQLMEMKCMEANETKIPLKESIKQQAISYAKDNNLTNIQLSTVTCPCGYSFKYKKYWDHIHSIHHKFYCSHNNIE